MDFWQQLLITFIGGALSIAGSIACTLITLGHYRRKEKIDNLNKINYERPRLAIIKGPFDVQDDEKRKNFIISWYDNQNDENLNISPYSFNFTYKNSGARLITNMYLCCTEGILKLDENINAPWIENERCGKILRIPRTLEKDENIIIRFNFYIKSNCALQIFQIYLEDDSGRAWKQTLYMDNADSSNISAECSRMEFRKILQDYCLEKE